MKQRVTAKLAASKEKLKQLFPRYAAPLQPVVTYQNGWKDDAQLRTLAKASETGHSNWMFGFDMAVFYQAFDSYNRNCPPDMRARVLVSSQMHERLKFHMEIGSYQSSNIGTINMEGMSFEEQKDCLFGLRSISEDDMVLEMQGRQFPVRYSGTPMRTDLKILTPQGWVSPNFEALSLFKAQLATQDMPLERIPA